MESVPSDTDLNRKFDEVSKTVREVNNAVSAIAAKTGVAFKPGFDPLCPPGTPTGEKIVAVATHWAVPQESFTVERLEGDWQIVYTRTPTPAMTLLGEKPSRTPIVDCSLEVKRLFLKHVVEFVKFYKEAAFGRLNDLDKDIGRGKEAIDLLSK